MYVRPPSAPRLTDRSTVRVSRRYTHRLYRARWTRAIGKCEQEMRIWLTKCEVGFFELWASCRLGCLFRTLMNSLAFCCRMLAKGLYKRTFRLHPLRAIAAGILET